MGKNLSDVFPIRNGLKKVDALLSLLFNFALGYAIKKVQVIQDGLKLNDTHQLLVYVDDVNPLPVQFKAVLRGQKGCVFFSGHLNLPATPEIGLPSREKNHNN